MAAPLNTCSTIEQRGVVRFLWAKNMEAKDIHIPEMLPIWAAFPCLDFQRDVTENSRLLGCDAASLGECFQTFRENKYCLYS
jgi:hypothetical protein